MQILEPKQSHLNIYPLSERAVTVEFGNAIHERFLTAVDNLNQLLLQKPFPGFCSSVPAYTTLAVFFDPVEVIKSNQLTGASCLERVSTYLNQLKATPATNMEGASKLVAIPVCYGGDFGPDIEEVASIHQLTVEQVISLHSSVIYKVCMIGFVPGFAYLGGMDASLATHRKQTPRKVVPAGSVGIAGAQTGIYPLQTPGGWQIIGRTPLTMFDASRPKPSLLKAGDEVQFKMVDHLRFNQLSL